MLFNAGWYTGGECLKMPPIQDIKNIAQFWNSNFSPLETAENKPQTDPVFVVIGTLELQVYWQREPPTSWPAKKFEFRDVGIAYTMQKNPQYHYGYSPEVLHGWMVGQKGGVALPFAQGMVGGGINLRSPDGIYQVSLRLEGQKGDPEFRAVQQYKLLVAPAVQEYWTKQLPFLPLPKTQLTGAKFTTSALSISAGQDPLQKNKVGGSLAIDSPHGGGGTFPFEVGLAPSNEVATFWNNTLRYSEYTPTSRPELLEEFSPPSQLFFAFMGTLELRISIGALPIVGQATTTWLKFRDVLIGWGWSTKYRRHTWYFGAKGAKPYGGTIASKSTQSVTLLDSEGKYEVLFYRDLDNMDYLRVEVTNPPPPKKGLDKL